MLQQQDQDALSATQHLMLALERVGHPRKQQRQAGAGRTIGYSQGAGAARDDVVEDDGALEAHTRLIRLSCKEGGCVLHTVKHMACMR